MGGKDAFWVLLDKRINLKAGPPPKWRRLSERYQASLIRDQRRLHERVRYRIVLYRFETPELNRRFAYLLPATWEEYRERCFD